MPPDEITARPRTLLRRPPRRATRRGRLLPLLAGALLTLFAPAGVALAGKITVDVDEAPGRATVRLRATGSDLSEPKIARSRRGLLLFFEGDEVDASRLYAGTRRLRFVQTGQAGSRAAVRIVQRDSARGPIREFARIKPVPGGYDVEVVDSYPRAEAETPAAGGSATDDDGTSPAPSIQGDPSPARPAATRETSLARLLGEPTPPLDAPASAPAPAGSEPAPLAEAQADPTPPVTQAAITSDDPAPPAPSPLPTADDASRDEAAPEPAAALTEADEGWARPDDDDGASPASTSPWAVFGAFGPVLLLAGGAAWILRRRRRPGPRNVEVTERISVGPKQTVLCVRVGGKDLLIGATEQGMSVLTEIDAASSAPAASPSPRPAAPSTAARADQPEPEPEPDPAARVAAFKARLAAALRDDEPADDDGPTLLHAGDLEFERRDPPWTRHREVA